jgi:hypothetical protein
MQAVAVHLTGLLLLAIVAISPLRAHQSDETPYAASRLVGRWRTVMNRALEDQRTFASEAVADLMEEFVSPGAVRAVQDKAGEPELQKADAALRRFVDAMSTAGERQPDGSVVVDERTIEPARRAICPVYPFCDR